MLIYFLPLQCKTYSTFHVLMAVQVLQAVAALLTSLRGWGRQASGLTFPVLVAYIFMQNNTHSTIQL